METTENKYDGAKETSRIESFSDAVFAIAITLLILDIHVPEVKENETLLKSLANEWASILALLIGFFTILICWINHHFMFQMIHKSNGMLLLINGFKLLVVTVTPFVTSVLSKYIQTDWKETAVNIYCFNFALMGIAMTAIWCYAYKKGFAKASSGKILEATKRLYIFAGTFSTIIWIVSFFNIMACLILSGVMFIFFISPKQTVNWLVKRSKQ